MTADGPAGLRILPECGVCTTAWPCATLLACTWNPEIVYEVGAAGAKEVKENLYTQNHYLLLSIFRNLFNNAIEAADGNPVELSVRQSSTDSSYVIEVEDHGPGIDPEDMEQIFEPGFSTKINYETGEVNRGLGLSLVKDFIELRLGGTIQVTSVPGKTVFTLTIPKEKWSGL